jgi:hypothetical protein
MDTTDTVQVPVQHSSPPIVLDTVFLLFLRLVYFLISRRYLLHTLNPTLRDLSKPETLLPPPQGHEVSHARAHGGPVRGGPSVSSGGDSGRGVSAASEYEIDSELGLEDEDDDDNIMSATTISSYPVSPCNLPVTGGSLSLPPYASSSRTNNEYLSAGSSTGHGALPTIPEAGGIELENLGKKLKDVGKGIGRRVPFRVLQLSHGGSKDVSKGTKGTKKTTRELSRLAR